MQGAINTGTVLSPEWLHRYIHNLKDLKYLLNNQYLTKMTFSILATSNEFT